jgi:heme/copper-type cytochrome/quinol oxidase subunit 2
MFESGVGFSGNLAEFLNNMRLGVVTAMGKIFALVFILIAFLQFYFAYKYQRVMKNNGTATPMTFYPITIWSNYVSSVIFFVLGLSLLFGQLSH